VLEQYPTADMASEAAFQLLFPAFLDKRYQKVIDLARKYIPLFRAGTTAPTVDWAYGLPDR
jgi:outer membrane protein assembly factor BamD (BamD/ComL family)